MRIYRENSMVSGSRKKPRHPDLPALFVVCP